MLTCTLTYANTHTYIYRLKQYKSAHISLKRAGKIKHNFSYTAKG